MRISVVIPCLNEEGNLGQAIRSVTHFADEVILTDGGSTDGSIEIANSLGTKLVHARRGRGYQLRAGAKEATGDMLLFLHADSRLSLEGGSQLANIANQQEKLFGCFRQCIADSHFRFRVIESGNAFRASRFGLPYGDQGIFVDRRSYEDVGGFDEVPLMEDVMLCQRLRKTIWPSLLEGPLHLSPRRWKQDGVIRRTLRNWFIFCAFRAGVSPERLAKWYG